MAFDESFYIVSTSIDVATVIEHHPLPPFLPPDARVLMLGSFPPQSHRWRMNFYYPNYQNDMWRIMGLVFFQNANHFLDLTQKSFYLDKIQCFLVDYGIAIYDAAQQVRRLKDNASDQFLEIVQPTDIASLIQHLPCCKAICTTGDKATQTLMSVLPKNSRAPDLKHTGHTDLDGRLLDLYRLPSSSRAYPLALSKKAEIYRQFFINVNLISETF